MSKRFEISAAKTLPTLLAMGLMERRGAVCAWEAYELCIGSWSFISEQIISVISYKWISVDLLIYQILFLKERTLHPTMLRRHFQSHDSLAYKRPSIQE